MTTVGRFRCWQTARTVVDLREGASSLVSVTAGYWDGAIIAGWMTGSGR